MEPKNKRKIISFFLAIGVWQLIAMCIKSNILIASPIDVLMRFPSLVRDPMFARSVAFSLSRIGIGYIIGVVLALVLGFLADRFKIIEDLIWPYMVTIRSVPVASIVVICLVWLSAGNLSGFVSFLIVLPVLYNAVLSGLKGRDEELEEVSRVYDVTGLEKIRMCLLPQIIPGFLSACGVTAGMAWKAGVAAEVIGTPSGSIGRQLYLAKTYLDTVDLFAWTLTIVIVSVLFEKIILLLLKIVLYKWCDYK